jgi:Tol biopolymer transport system component
MAFAIVLAAPPEARACCDVTPSVTDEFRGFLGSISPPALTPGLTAQVFARPAICQNPTRSAAADFAVPSGCTLGTGPCTELAASDFVVSLFYRPTAPSAAHNVVVMRSDCSNPAANSCPALPGGGAVACVQYGPEQFVINDVPLPGGGTERRLFFVVPDTTNLFGGQLAGPAAVAVTRATDPLACGLASETCKEFFGTSPLVTCSDTLYVNDSTCTTDAGSVDPVGVSVTALPSPNRFADLCPLSQPGCSAPVGVAPPVQAVQDAAGNVLVPVNFEGFTGDPNFAVLLQGGLNVGGTAVPIPSANFVETRSLRNFAEVLPLFEASPVPGSEGVVQGTLDARLIVYRIFDSACSNDPQLPCSVDAECGPGGTCGTTGPSIQAVLPAANGGTGPVAGTCADDAGNPVCNVIDSFVDVESVSQGAEDNRMRLFTVNECAAQLAEPPLTESRNDDGLAQELPLDLLDQVLVMRDGDDNLEIQKPRNDGFDGLAVTRIQELPFDFGSQDAENEVAAWLSPELGSCFAEPALCDRTGNGLVFDHLLEAFQLDEVGSDSAIDLLAGATLQDGQVPTNGPGEFVSLRGDLASSDGNRLVLGAEPGRNVGTASVQVSDGLVFFRASPFAHLARTTQLVDANNDGTPSAGVAREPRVSPDGGFVTFTSRANDLAPGNNTTDQVFLKNLETGSILRVSEPNCFQQSEAEQFDPNSTSGGGVPSRDGRYVAFWSFANNLVPGDGNNRPDVFVRDTESCDVVRVSVNGQGTEGNDISLNPWISADGRRVVFESRAGNLDAAVPDTNGAFDVFLHDRDPEGNGFDGEFTTMIVSVATTGPSAGGAATGASNQAVVAEDGESVALASTAGDLVPGDGNGQVDVFAGAPGDLDRASTPAEGGSASLSSLKPRISGNGRFVSFVSDSALVPEDQNGRRDAYVKDLETGQVRWSGAYRGAPECRESVEGLTQFVPDANGLTQDVAISADGDLIAYATTSSNLVPNDATALSDIVVEDLRTGHVALLSASADGSSSGSGASSLPSIGNRTFGYQSLAGNLGPLTVSPLNAYANRPADGSDDLRPRLGVIDTRTVPAQVSILDLPAEHVKAAGGAALVVADGETAKLVRETCDGVIGGPACSDSCESCGLVVEDLLHPAVSDQEAIAISEPFDSDPGDGVSLKQFACALVTDVLPGGEPVASCHEVGTDPASSLDPVPGGGNVPAESIQTQNGKVLFLSPENGGLGLYEMDLVAGGAARRVQPVDKAVLGDEIACFTTFRRDFETCQGADCDKKEMFIVVPGTGDDPLRCDTSVRDCDLRSCFPALPFSVVEPDTCKYITSEEVDAGPGNACVAAGLDLNFDGECTLLVQRCKRVVREDGTTESDTFVGEVVVEETPSNPVEPEAPGDGDVNSGIVGLCYPLVEGVPDLTAEPSGPCPCSPFEFCFNDGETGATTLNPDSDGDGIPDADDFCPLIPDTGVDFDGDGFDDVCSPSGCCDGFVCGDGILQRAEVCDEGSANGQPGSACSAGCIPQVAIDIRPPFHTNPIVKGSPFPIGVAILGSELLEPHHDIDRESLVFAASVAGQPCVTDPAHGARALDFELPPIDVNHDGFVDLVAFFRIADAHFELSSTEACLTGAFVDEIGPFGLATFEARDQVRVIRSPFWCGLGAELALVLPPLLWLRRRASERRNRSAERG